MNFAIIIGDEQQQQQQQQKGRKEKKKVGWSVWNENACIFGMLNSL